MEKITLNSLYTRDIKEYIEKLEKQEKELITRIAKAKTILKSKSK